MIYESNAKSFSVIVKDETLEKIAEELREKDLCGRGDLFAEHILQGHYVSVVICDENSTLDAMSIYSMSCGVVVSDVLSSLIPGVDAIVLFWKDADVREYIGREPGKIDSKNGFLVQRLGDEDVAELVEEKTTKPAKKATARFVRKTEDITDPTEFIATKTEECDRHRAMLENEGKRARDVQELATLFNY